MNSAESSDEPPSSTREDGASSATERPHKKARFAWQIKGKYHLKNSSQEANDIPSNRDPEPEPHPETEKAPEQPEIANSIEVSSSEPGPSRPAAVSFNESHNSADNSDQVHERYRKRNPSDRDWLMDPKNQANCRIYGNRIRNRWEYYNAAWKEEQLQKCFYDNALNCLLEKTREQVLDVTEIIAMNESIQEVHGFHNIVDRAIVMAISSHGLQAAKTLQDLELEDNDSSDSQMSPDNAMPEETLNKTRESSPIPEKSQSASPVPSDDKMSDDETNNLDMGPEEILEPNLPTEDSDADFMNTAVLHAIQSKGLVTWTGFG